ncbi:hypothetical protein MTR_5g017300 [Medicago truncatula]|uniref:Uncharacterized protein n=1 Tax=Medicago truncatula TaxID=3880 RepID=G7K6N8_MEDTR|nr:hypothetical protein MTR_5g017300 [Medicago truncatula]
MSTDFATGFEFLLSQFSTPFVFAFEDLCSHLNFIGGRYQGFLGLKQYSVSSDDGVGKMQWYAFQESPKNPLEVSTPPSGKHS